MSTKIHHGYEVNCPDLEQTLEMFRNALPGFRKDVRKISDQELSWAVQYRFDKSVVSGENKDWLTCWLDTLDVYNKEATEIDVTGIRSPSYDFGCSVTVFPHSSGIFAMVFCDRKDITDILLSHVDMKHFPYWNNTDKPDGLNDTQWERRGELWDDVLGYELEHSVNPSEHGFSFTFSQTLIPSYMRQCFIEQSIDKRCENVAADIIINDRLGDDFKFSDDLRELKQLKTTEGTVELLLRAEEVRPILLRADDEMRNVDYTVTVNVPSGVLVFANNLCPPRDEDKVLSRYDVNSFEGKKKTTEDYAKDYNLLFGFVGNSCPGVYLKGKEIIVAAVIGDEDNEPLPHDFGVDIGWICTDLWWFSAMDRDQYISRGFDDKDAFNVFPDGGPGIYEMTMHKLDDSYEHNTKYATIRKIRD